ncbi:glycosyltransferase family 2 protein [Streptacidiphilus sp. N1-12]|uniref:Glycosyltransferase family 2 protein n=2 Tax=Streptacidiphilus alkalitolerans TaxID=3342712 RepID=A0ABV6W8F5_9ACTN
MSHPQVTVICPTYNRSTHLVATLGSVQAQTVRDFELLVVSDGSTDDTDEVVRAAAAQDDRIRLIRIPHQGHPSTPRNTGLAEARGEVVAYLDHDDRWRPDHLDVLLRTFADGAALVATGFTRVDAAGAVTAESRSLALCWHPEIQVLGPLFEPSRVAHLRGLPERVGGWRNGVGLEDWDLWLRLTDAGLDFTTVPDRTALLLDDTGTRRYRTPRRHLLPLAVFDDPRRAHAALRELQDARHSSALRTAHRDDTRAWYGRLSTAPRFHAPRGWDGDLDAEIDAATSDDTPLWPELHLLPRQGRYVLAQTLWCSTESHAARLRTLARRVQATHFALIDTILAPHGATPLVVAQRPAPAALLEPSQ